MEKTFHENAPKLSEAERHAQNEERQKQGEPQIAGSAGRESVPTKDPKEFDPRGGPGSSGNKPIQDPVV